MTKDEIIKLAREAGFVVDGDSWVHAGAVLIDGRKSIDKQLKAFADLVAAHKAEVALAEAYRCGHEAGAVAEREACAKVCEAGINNATDWDSSYWDQCCENRAAAIRARIDK